MNVVKLRLNHMRIPFFEALNDSRAVLIAGAGGGFDVFAGLPLYFWLRAAGKTVHLANLSFTVLDFCEGERPVPSVLRVTPDTRGPNNYFPEFYLAQWFASRSEAVPVFAIDRSGGRAAIAAYEWLVSSLKPDTLILVDGGMDSLMRGDEIGLGTPEEDMVSLLAANAVAGVENKYLACVGFGVDFFHGVCHASFLENVAGLIREGGYLGAWAVTREMQEFQLYKEAAEFVMARMPLRPSIVNTSIASAVEGQFGNYHATRRTQGSKLFINPLMAFYWAFRLEHVARRNLYLDQIRDTYSYGELSRAIEMFRASLSQTRPWASIPC